MSIKLPSGEASDVWNYPTRTLTVRFTVIERISPSYYSSLSLIYNVKRRIKAGTIFVLVTDGNQYNVVVDDDDLIPKARETIVDTGFSPGNMKDHDDSTASTSTTTSTPNSEIELVRYDLGSLYNGWFYVIFEPRSTTAPGYQYDRIYVSSDGTTWTKVLDVSPSSKTTYLVYVTNVRYISLKVANTTTTSNYYMPNIYSFEFYPENLRKVLEITSEVTRTLKVFGKGYVQLLEVISV